MSTQTSNAEAYKKLNEPLPEAAADNTVLAHVSLVTPEGKTAREVWVHHDVRYALEGELFSLQPGQVAMAWQRDTPNSASWTPLTPMVINTATAFVYDGRYMVKGGNSDPKSHAKITDWERASPSLPQHAATELRTPGGARRLTLQALDIPALVASRKTDIARFVSTAKLFHALAREMKLVDYDRVAPITLVTPAEDAAMARPLGGAAPVFAFDILSATVRKYWALPIPTILSDVESEVLAEQPEGWLDAVQEYLTFSGITEVGVMRSQLGDEKMSQDYSTQQSQVIVRATIPPSTLGTPVLDPDLYERMLPFQGGILNVDAFAS